MGHATRISTLQSKIWGLTTNLFSSPYVEVHLIKVNPGGFCSRHIHEKRWNSFYILKGSLDVLIYRKYGDKEFEEKTTLKVGECSDVPPQVEHRFQCNEYCEALEIYWVDEIEGSDIVRKDNGGLNKPAYL